MSIYESLSIMILFSMFILSLISFIVDLVERYKKGKK